ncbi:hypothetical protein TSAR_012187 [Trichomalopsis sarcophagae]|uniref:Swi5-dependent recombination DNA repair protein 1 homolog n=1 Tax=Trichomalopsis sarcophagae TaxID=543379 RepID=A0A232ETV8_9HYME|nr:hypothetical protein TSAR_012187 [Trichomalopsis sarcophagae]
MLRTPLKNSKLVNKPFKSPFESPAQKKDDNKSHNKSAQKDCEVADSPLSTRNSEAKRVLLLDDNKRIKRKKLLTDDEKDESETSKCSTLDEGREAKKQKLSHDDNQETVPENVTKTDLHLLKRKIFEIRQELDCLKSRERCSKKHDPKVLKVSIDRWRTACQNALEIVCSELRERNGQSSTISDVLKMLGIPESIVHYSEKDDGFI